MRSMHLWPVWVILATASAGHFVCAQEAVLSVDDVAKGIAEGQSQLLKAAGGISIQFHVRVEQPPDGPLAFREGKGTIRVKWPRLYSRFESNFKGVGPVVRQANYDFERKDSTALDGKSEAIISPYRAAWSAAYLYPLRLSYFVQADQYYYEGAVLKTDKWLPNALQQANAYTVEQGGTVDGIRCLHLQCPGFDSLWLAPDRAYMVVKRELNFGAGKPLRERTINRQFREVLPGAWIPTSLLQENFDFKTNQLSHTIQVTIDDISVGDVDDDSLAVVIPKDVLEVSDQFRNVTIRNPQGTRPFTNALAEARRSLTSQRGAEWRGIRNWALLAVTLGVLLVIVVLRGRRVRASRP